MVAGKVMRVNFGKKFRKQYRTAPKAVQETLKERLMLFSRDKFSPLLNNHQLKGRFEGCRSINVGGDWRAIFDESQNGDVFFSLLGTHSQLYK